MPLDLNKVKAKLAALQSKGGTTFEKTDFTKIYYKPKQGTQQIRIVPSKYCSADWPFQEVTFHENIVKKRMYTLTNFGEKDPIIDFANLLKAEAASLKSKGQNSDEEWNYAKKLRPKVKTYAQVIVRGEEHLGTRLWEFGPKVMEQLMKIAANPDYENFYDIHEGTDLNVEGVPANYNGNQYIEPSISPRKKESPLSTNEEELKRFLDIQHDPLGFKFLKYSYEQMSGFFQQWLNPEDAVDTPAPEVEAVVAEPVIEELEAEEVIAEEETDDLPFTPDPPKIEVKAATRKVTQKVSEVAKKVTAAPSSNKDKFKSLFPAKK